MNYAVSVLEKIREAIVEDLILEEWETSKVRQKLTDVDDAIKQLEGDNMSKYIESRIDSPEPKYSSLTDWEGEEMFEGEEYLDLHDEFRVPYDKTNEFMEWYIEEYKTEAKEALWEMFEDAGIWSKA